MSTTAAFTSVVAALALVLAGCAAAEPEPQPSETTVAEIERDFDIGDACSLLTASDVVAAMGYGDTGSIDDTRSGRNANSRPVCEWAFDPPTRAAVGFLNERTAVPYDVRLTLHRFQPSPSCFEGLPCNTPEEFVTAWGAEWEAWYDERFDDPGQAEPIPSNLVISPDLLGGAATAGMRGAIFIDPEYWAEIELFWCSNPQCRAGIEGMQQALDAKFG